MSVNEFVPQETALLVENTWVQAYMPGSDRADVEECILSMVQTLTHMLLSPNGKFNLSVNDIKPLMVAAIDKAAETAHHEELVKLDRENGYMHCEVTIKHDVHQWLEADTGKWWDCSGKAVKKH